MLRIASVLTFLLLVLQVHVHAQDTLSTQLDEVVVTGQYEAQSAKKSVYSVRTIPMEHIQNKGASSLQEILNTELNFRFNQDLAVGAARVTMNGLSGQYVKVLIDGVPMVGKQGTENEIDLNQININTIERIEIVEGPMAVNFGADAMAGVINLITKKVADEQLDISTRLQEESIGNSYGGSNAIHNQHVALAYGLKKFYVKAEAGRNYFGGWQGDSTARELEWHKKTQVLGGTVVGWRQNKTHIYYRLDVLSENIYNPGNFSSDVAFDQRYRTTRFMHQVQADMALHSKLDYSGAVAYTSFTRNTQSVNVNESTGRETLSLGEGHQDETSFNGLTARGTFLLKWSDYVTLQPGYDFNFESGSGGRIQEVAPALSDYALFVSAEIQPTKKLSVRPGVRMMKNSQYDAPPLTPALNAKWVINKTIDFRFAYARGFRAPSLRELYFLFKDASHDIVGNKNLEAELSHNINTSFNWQFASAPGAHQQIVVGYFYNTIDNMIDTEVIAGTTQASYFNVNKFKSQGGTISYKLRYGNWDGNAGVAYTGRYNDISEDDHALVQFKWSPEITANFTYSFTRVGLNASVFYKYTGKLPFYEKVTVEGTEQTHLATINGFHWLDCSLQKEIVKGLQITAGARNVLNIIRVQNTSLASGGHSSTGPKPVGYGRSYFVNINFQMQKLRH